MGLDKVGNLFGYLGHAIDVGGGYAGGGGGFSAKVTVVGGGWVSVEESGGGGGERSSGHSMSPWGLGFGELKNRN